VSQYVQVPFCSRKLKREGLDAPVEGGHDVNVYSIIRACYTRIVPDRATSDMRQYDTVCRDYANTTGSATSNDTFGEELQSCRVVSGVSLVGRVRTLRWPADGQGTPALLRHGRVCQA
jgi:hypothetical protein